MRDLMEKPANLALALLAPNLRRHPDKAAYLCAEESISHRRLAEATGAFAALLASRGITRGDRVMFVLPDSPLLVAAILGTILHGAVAVPVSTTLAEADYRQILDDCGASLLLAAPSTGAATLPGVESVAETLSQWLERHSPGPLEAPAPDANDLAFMLYTSGTTGRPKGVPHGHGDLLVAARNYGHGVLGLNADDRIFSASKLSFAYGLGNSLAFPLFSGATAILLEDRATPEAVLGQIARHRPSVFFAIPTIYGQIIRSVAEPGLALPLRLCVSAGEALPVAFLEAWKQLTGLEVLDGIGSTEATHIFISNRPGQVVPGSVGTPVPGYAVRLVDEGESIVPSGTPGQLQISGDSLFPGYWNQPEMTRALRLDDGFIRTGDVFIERDGYYFHQGRSDDMLKVGGQWVSPLLLEETLRQHPGVADCAVVATTIGGLDCAEAYVVPRHPLSQSVALERELSAFLADRLPPHMRPIRYHRVDSLPRTATGKVQRFKLRTRS